MKKLFTLVMTLALIGAMVSACDDNESYADKKKKERKAVDAFIARDPLLLLGPNNDTLLSTPGIRVISQEQFEAQDSTTDVSRNEYVLFANKGIYMQIVRQGVGEKIRPGETKRVICRYWEYNILADSLQSTDRAPYWATNPEILDVSNNSGTINASFNTSINGGGAMYLLYNETAVPSGWIVPMSYIKLGRQTGEDGIALVRLIVPHTEGTSSATSSVYPCFYEISYQEMRD